MKTTLVLITCFFIAFSSVGQTAENAVAFPAAENTPEPDSLFSNCDVTDTSLTVEETASVEDNRRQNIAAGITLTTMVTGGLLIIKVNRGYRNFKQKSKKYITI